MRIGILTLPLFSNYGGILQAYALQTVLERLGHEVRVIDCDLKDFRFPSWKRPLVYVKRGIKKVLVDPSIELNVEAKMRRERPILWQYVTAFQKRYIKFYLVRTVADIKREDFDAIVVGSDQIWRLMYIRNSWLRRCSQAFLGFTKGWDIKRYAYAASFGVDRWEYSKRDTAECATLAKDFDAISVREDSAVDLCRKYLDVEVVHLLDPTLLLRAEDYGQLIDAAPLSQDGGGELLSYILDNSQAKKELIERISRERKMSVFTVNAKGEEEAASFDERIYPPVERWLKGFADARMVVTDSFHGCIFSILFGKPFVVIGNVERGLSRMRSLLRMFGLEDHLLFNVSEYESDRSYAQPSIVRERINELRRQSMDFLSKIQ